MSISTDVHKPCVCDPLGPFISLVNKYIDPMMVMMGYEVDKLPNFLSKHQTHYNTLNHIFKTSRHQEPMILLSSMYEKNIPVGFT